MAKATLIVRLEYSDGRQEDVSFDLPAIRVGRDPSNDLVVKDTAVSRHHAMILRRDNSIEIHNVSSRNGITVKGQKVDRVEMELNDPFTLGSTVLRVLSEDAETLTDLEKELDTLLDDGSRSGIDPLAAYEESAPRSRKKDGSG